MVVLSRDPIAPDVASDRDSRSTPMSLFSDQMTTRIGLRLGSQHGRRSRGRLIRERERVDGR